MIDIGLAQGPRRGIPMVEGEVHRDTCARYAEPGGPDDPLQAAVLIVGVGEDVTSLFLNAWGIDQLSAGTAWGR